MVHNKFRKDRIMKQRNVLTSAGGGGRRSTGKSSEIASNLAKCRTGSAGGFTMAEILLSLTIIGVVAAITLPSLTGNINERTWNTQRKALYARFSQALALMPALNGYGTFTEDESGNITEDTVAETFVTAGLSKVLKINNICDSEHLSDCGIVSTFTTLIGTQSVMPTKISEMNSQFVDVYDHGNYTLQNPQSNIDTKAAAFETANGESVVVFYNPACLLDANITTSWHYSQPLMCANFIYDLNGLKGPNTVGKDIGFITAMYPSDSVVVAPVPLTRPGTASVNFPDASSQCKGQDSESRLPNRDELSSLFYNMNLLGITDVSADSQCYWSGSLISSNSIWYQCFGGGRRHPSRDNLSLPVWCVKR